MGCGPDKLRFHQLIRRCDQFLIGFLCGVHSPQELGKLTLFAHIRQFKLIVFQMLPLYTWREGPGGFTNSEVKQFIILNDKRKKLSVWVDSEKYETFKAAVKEDGNSIYGLINAYIDDYLKSRTH